MGLVAIYIYIFFTQTEADFFMSVKLKKNLTF